MNVRELLGKRMLFLTAVWVQCCKNGMGAGEIPELLNLTNAALIEKIHTEYLEAGANIITTNTFGANPLKSGRNRRKAFDMIIAAAIGIARKAVNSFQSEENPRFVAFDIGPCGKLFRAFGRPFFDDCYDAFAKIAKTAERMVADLVIIETMSDHS